MSVGKKKDGTRIPGVVCPASESIILKSTVNDML